MEQTEQTLIIIPDISGFSSFVNEVAISHAEHIIRELLEIVMDSNDLGLAVSEVEGDAVLFFKMGSFPEPKAILQMVEKMFIRFHEHLQLYKRNRLCQCGACQTAHELNLKVIIDQGFVKQMQVKQHRKLVGPAMIAAHRLLKNRIPSDEYLLLSERYVDYQKCLRVGEAFDWITWQQGQEYYEDMGEVSYQYSLLSPLKKRVRTPEQRQSDFTVKNPVVLAVEVEVPYTKAYQTLIDSSQKRYWVKGIQKVIKANEAEIDQIGSKHLCVVNGTEMDLEAVKSYADEQELAFMEVMQRMGPLKNIALQYRCFPKGNEACRIQVEMHYQNRPFLAPLGYLALFMAKRHLRQSINFLKLYLENNKA